MVEHLKVRQNSFIIYAELLLHVKVEMKYYKRNGLEYN